jgi:hypothetical protein
MADPVLADGQYSVDGLVFGKNTQLLVAKTQVDPAQITAQDQPLSGRDGIRFGTDYMTSGKTITFTGNVWVGPNDSIGAQDVYAQLEAAWNNREVRLVPGAVSVLRFNYPNSQVSRRVYGRGRSIAPTLGSVARGAIPFVAAFVSADPNVYSDMQYSVNLKLSPTDLGTPVNLLANPGFESGLTGWVGTGGVLTLDNTHVHSGLQAAKFVPTGGTAGYYQSTVTAIKPNVGYIATGWIYAPAALSRPIALNINTYDVSGTYLETITSPTFAPVAGQWYPVSFPFTATDSSAVGARVVPTLSGTPLATDIFWGDDFSLVLPNGGAAPPFTPPVLLAALSSVEQGVNNAGPLWTWPIIVFNGPITNPKLTLPDLGVSIMLQANVASGVSVSIDTQPWACTILDQFGNSYAGDAVGNSLADLGLPPGFSRVQFTGQDPTNQSSCQLLWRSATGTIGGTTI